MAENSKFKTNISINHKVEGTLGRSQEVFAWWGQGNSIFGHHTRYLSTKHLGAM
ncbi:MAG: hypothetical protein Ct9H300mP11_03780 [Chloroflexota bacterium]|nr:MAG: hypothetical protein Ct9H300mP11_03780 [Chloroflexota bacterium]